MDADGALHQRPVEAVVRGRVGDRRDLRHRRPHRVGRAEESLAQRDSLLLRLVDLRPQHQLREIHRELVRRNVRALRIAELALVAELDDLPVIAFLEQVDRVLGPHLHLLEEPGGLVLLDHRAPFLEVLSRGLAGVRIELVDPVEHHREGGAQRVAEAAAVADLEDPVQLLVEIGLVEEERRPVVHPVGVGDFLRLFGVGALRGVLHGPLSLPPSPAGGPWRSGPRATSRPWRGSRTTRRSR